MSYSDSPRESDSESHRLDDDILEEYQALGPAPSMDTPNISTTLATTPPARASSIPPPPTAGLDFPGEATRTELTDDIPSPGFLPDRTNLLSHEPAPEDVPVVTPWTTTPWDDLEANVQSSLVAQGFEPGPPVEVRRPVQPFNIGAAVDIGFPVVDPVIDPPADPAVRSKKLGKRPIRSPAQLAAERQRAMNACQSERNRLRVELRLPVLDDDRPGPVLHYPPSPPAASANDEQPRRGETCVYCQVSHFPPGTPWDGRAQEDLCPRLMDLRRQEFESDIALISRHLPFRPPTPPRPRPRSPSSAPDQDARHALQDPSLHASAPQLPPLKSDEERARLALLRITTELHRREQAVAASVPQLTFPRQEILPCVREGCPNLALQEFCPKTGAPKKFCSDTCKEEFKSFHLAVARAQLSAEGASPIPLSGFSAAPFAAPGPPPLVGRSFHDETMEILRSLALDRAAELQAAKDERAERQREREERREREVSTSSLNGSTLRPSDVARILHRPDKIDGHKKGTQFLDEQVKHAAKYFTKIGVPDDQLAEYLAGFLTGDALTWLNSESIQLTDGRIVPANSPGIPYADLSRALQARFWTAEDDSALHMQYKMFKQVGSASNYAMEWSKLRARVNANPRLPTYTDDQAGYSFLEGLLDNTRAQVQSVVATGIKLGITYTLPELIEQARLADRTLNPQLQKAPARNNAIDSQPGAGSDKKKAKDKGGKGEKPKVSTEEKERRKALDLCLYCGESHMAKSARQAGTFQTDYCPTLMARRAGQPVRPNPQRTNATGVGDAPVGADPTPAPTPPATPSPADAPPSND